VEAWPPGNTRTEREREREWVRERGRGRREVQEYNAAKVCANAAANFQHVITNSAEQPRDLINESSSEFLIALSIPRLLGRIRDVTLNSFERLNFLNRESGTWRNFSSARFLRDITVKKNNLAEESEKHALR